MKLFRYRLSMCKGDGMEEWKECKLKDICDYGKDRIEVSSLDNSNYISTENMLPNRAGITTATTLPTGELTPSFEIDDTLVSNIRPYFKKIWKATFSGGCSADVLVFKAKENVSKEYLYYVLADDEFFKYSMTTSKGTKMPRGDKTSIMNYPVKLPPLPTQQKIAAILSSLDDKIELNNKINTNLEQQAGALFKNWFANKIDNVSEKDGRALDTLIDIVDNRGKTPPSSNEKNDFPILDVGALNSTGRIIDYKNCTKYVDEQTYNTFFRDGHPRENDILISTVGSLAQMKFFKGDKGCIAQNVVAFRTLNTSPFYLYEYLKFIKNDLLAYDIGSVQPSIKVTHIIKHLIYIPTNNELSKFDSFAKSITEQIYNNVCENERLISIRDTLLPKLMNGEIEV